MSRTGSSRGFTLVELTIVIFIMATMMAVAVPYFLQYYRESKLSSAAREFVTATQLARLQAATRQRPAKMQFDLDRQSYWISQATGSDSNLTENSLVESFVLPLNIRIATVQVGEDRVADAGEVSARFYPNGTCDGFTVVLRGQDKKAGTAIWVDPVTARATPYAVK